MDRTFLSVLGVVVLVIGLFVGWPLIENFRGMNQQTLVIGDHNRHEELVENGITPPNRIRHTSAPASPERRAPSTRSRSEGNPETVSLTGMGEFRRVGEHVERGAAQACPEGETYENDSGQRVQCERSERRLNPDCPYTATNRRTGQQVCVQERRPPPQG